MNTSTKVILGSTVLAAAAASVVIIRKRKRIVAVVEEAGQEVATVVFSLRDKLPWSNKPSPVLVDAIGKASGNHPKVPVVLLLAVGRNESNFRVGDCENPLKAGTFRREKGSWNKRKNQKIPGSDKTWADLYQPEEWGSYGAFQTLPYHFIGAGKAFPAGTPLCKGHDPYVNAEVAAGLLEAAYSKHGNWLNALAEYNAGPGGARSKEVIGRYVKHIAQHLTDLGSEARALLPQQIAGLAGLEYRRRDSYPVRNVAGKIVDWVAVY